MTPLQFEQQYAPAWDELAAELDALAPGGERHWGRQHRRPIDGVRLTQLYRMACEHLALARERNYPLPLTARLDDLTHRAHQLIYRERGWGLQSLVRTLLIEFPGALRERRRELLLAIALFAFPLLAMLAWCWYDPGAVLLLVSAEQANSYREMYASSSDGQIGRERGAGTDWTMFGFYIQHNIGIGFQCFAGGLLMGVGSVFYLLFNGLILGGVAGHLTALGHGSVFWPFVVGHSALELTAVVICGAAGLHVGGALWMPGRLSRTQSLREAALRCLPLVYGAATMLLMAAAVEAFWSSARWVEPWVKYTVGGLGWMVVIASLALGGRAGAAR